ncbi:MAG: uracil-DNA glycosylase [Bacilli bacterium]|nr:uracil-DNA glycosylase [Bacilli bacterium]
MKSWDNILNASDIVDNYKDINNKIEKEYNEKTIYPDKNNIYRALDLTKYEDVKVVILGQDPYHGEGEANGLAFSLNDNVKITPSLRNIFIELKDDLNIERTNKDLSGWAKQGVLLLNTILTVEKDKPLSHKDYGWEVITDYLIKYISDNKSNVVFILWGKNAERKEELIDSSKHLVIKSPHPSPFSARRGFFGSKPFSKTNNYLKKNNQSVIDWSL